MKCQKCGTELFEGAKFCHECGASLENKDIVEEVVVKENTQDNQEVAEETVETTSQEEKEVVEEVVVEKNAQDTQEIIEETAKTSSQEESEENQEPDKIWYYVSDNQSKGPYTENDMIEFIQNGTIKETTYVWKSGLKDWIYLKDSQLANYLIKEEKTEEAKTSKDGDWYYVNAGNQQTGPFTEEEMIQLIKNGIINGNTYVWKSGMTDWILLKDSSLFYSMKDIPDFNQTYSNGNRDKAYLETRSIPAAIILTIVTCGLYSLYWLYVLARDVNMLNARQGKPVGTDAGMVVLFSIITCGLYNIYFYWKAGKLLKQLEFNNHYYVEDNGLVMMLLSIFGFGIISNCILQSTLNDIQKYAE